MYWEEGDYKLWYKSNNLLSERLCRIKKITEGKKHDYVRSPAAFLPRLPSKQTSLLRAVCFASHGGVLQN